MFLLLKAIQDYRCFYKKPCRGVDASKKQIFEPIKNTIHDLLMHKGDNHVLVWWAGGAAGIVGLYSAWAPCSTVQAAQQGAEK